LDGYQELMLQTPAANAADVNFGNNAAQPGILVSTGDRIFFRRPGNLNNVWVIGNGTDALIVIVSQ